MGSAILLLATCNLRSYNTQVMTESAEPAAGQQILMIAECRRP